MMNETAHNYVIWDNRTVQNEDSQDKESMRILGNVSGAQNNIIYMSALSVTKPLKNEFKAGTYLGTGLLPFFSAWNGQVQQRDFVSALKNIRQSAFDPKQWYFFSNANWDSWEKESTADSGGPHVKKERAQELLNKKKREEMEKLWNYLNTKQDGRNLNGQKIKNELFPSGVAKKRFFKGSVK